jgi:hypothetical protein
MREPKKYRFYRRACLFTALVMLAESLAPTMSFALTGGPAQPEFSSFEPVATTNMVNDFSGDFTYNLPVVNIPGANGGGYALSLSYHAGTSTEEEASWVGYGWTLNPGAISRNKRGFPDDYNGSTVKYWNVTPANKTASVGASGNLEAFSFGIPLSVNASLRYNNYKGFGYSAGVGVQLANGLVSLGYSVSDGDGSFSVRINPAGLLSKDNDEDSKPKYDNKKKRSTMTDKQKAADTKAREAATSKSRGESTNGIGALSLVGSGYGVFTYGAGARAMNLTAYHGGSYNVTANVCATFSPLQVGPTFDLNGSYSWQENVNSSGVAGASDPLPVYGYMYSSKAPASGASMMDYYVEKLNPYDKQDKYLGQPFSNADNFGVSGEGLGGGFRLYNKKAGTFHPNSVSSKVLSLNLGVEVEAGLNIGGGGNLGVGFQQLTSNSWYNTLVNNTNFADSSSADEPYFFRYNNDQGGSVEFGTDETAQKASIQYGPGGGPKYVPVLSSNLKTTMTSGSRSGRSSYVSYHTNKEMLYTANGKAYKRYQFGDTTNAVYRKNLPDEIGELTTFNEDGLRYVYGQPVYSRKEGSLKYDLQNISAGAVDHNYTVYRDVTKNIKTKVGEERDVPYATSYLLTDITTPDYVDRTMDGPTDDDFGGYTRFSYNRLKGSYDKMNYADTSWYKWRIPYRGLQYDRGELSTQLDDMGSVNYGEKEIYYLDTIVTKTHFAVFTTSYRKDGYSAADNNSAANSRIVFGGGRLKELDRIDIYAKNPGGSPSLIKTVRFAYDNSLSTGMPNSGAAGTYGRLTLKKVWFEYNGIYNARINPYVFTYAYPTSTQEANFPAKYRTLKDTIFAAGDQNPVYSPFDIDPWGNYQKNGNNRYDSARTWVNQNPSPTFDPAAWQLKVIKLPTGGEIHIQYEQDDYAYVQDQPVHALISLKNTSSDSPITGNQYFLSMKDIGMRETLSDWRALRQKIQDLYVTPGKKIYFKFLYRLLDPLGNKPTINSCNSEYIKGYCAVKQVGIDSAHGGIYVRLGSSTISKYDLPKKVCTSYVKTQRLGSLDLSGNCNPAVDGIGSNTDPLQIVENLAGFITTLVTPSDLTICTAVNFPLSYLKVPIPKAKKGGGLRVKRLLMYDNGIESGDVSLFGSQYTYTLPDGTSSGVATNEPGGMREENALVQFDAKFQQSFLNKIVAGRDKEQVEIPLGEGIYPSPAVGYSRVTIQNIHSGITNTGFIVKEFYTAKDYPVKCDYTSIDSQRDFLPLPGGFVNIFINNLWLTQGFVFKLNNMHGQPRSETTYRGSTADIANATTSIGSQQVFSYFQPGEQVPMMSGVNNITWANPGKEMETVFDIRGMEDISHNLEIAFDIDVGVCIIPLPFASIAPSYTYTESKMYSHVTSKIINYPAIQKSVLSYADGIYHQTDNVAMNPLTGKPVLTRTADGYMTSPPPSYQTLALNQDANHSGRYYHYDFAGTTAYSQMGQKATNERKVLASNLSTVEIEKKSVSGKYYLEFTAATGQSVCSAMNSLYPGDLIKITKGTTDLGLFNVSDSISGSDLFILPTAAYSTNTTTSTSPGVVVEVIKSGLRNQLSQSIGSFTSYGDTARILPNASQTSKQRFADSLNAAAQYALAHHVSVSMIIANLPAGLMANVGGNCILLTSLSSLIIGPAGTNVTIDVGVGGFLVCENTYGPYFGLDPGTGQLDYFQPSNLCHGTPLVCLQFCPSQVNSSTQVVQAEAKTMDDHWPYDNTVFAQVSGSNVYENGQRGKWRQQSSYVYKDTIIGANAAGQRNYKNAGVFALNLFNWASPGSSVAQWIKLNTATQYSPDGNALEEQDILGIYSAAKFGYNGTQPYLVAKNTDYQSVQFESFENLYSSTKFEDGWTPPHFTRDLTYAHSGTASLKLVASDSVDLKPFKITQQMLNTGNGLDVKVWVKDTASTTITALRGSLTKSGAAIYVPYIAVARTGEWTLYEAKITNLSGFALNDVVTAHVRNSYTTKSVWIDDLRLQPLDAQVMAYVYDLATLRLIASFDDQNFGLFYQYNAEGKLVRKMVETLNGMKTVTETQYHTPGSARNN